MKSYINIKRLILVGVRKNYTIGFNPGVNIIYGDSDTGKSSILEFINYLLGCGDVELAEEISAAVNYAALELNINGNIITIKRDIYNSNAYIEVYNCQFEDCGKHFPDKYASSFKDSTAPKGYFSDYILDSLGFPKIKIKDAPSRLDSPLKRLSFRRLFKYCYLNQDNVGSKGVLDQGNWSKAHGTKEIFKYIFNVLDSSIAELDAELSEKTSDKNTLKQKYDVVSEFLREIDYCRLDELDDLLENVDSEIIVLEKELLKINKSMVANSETYLNLKASFDELVLNYKKTEAETFATQNLIDKYSRLKNDYENDIKKLESLKFAKESVGNIMEGTSHCPICDGNIDLSKNNLNFNVSPIESLNYELSSLQKRLKNIKTIIIEQSIKNKNVLKEKGEYFKDIEKARTLLDTESKNMVTPYLSQRDAIVGEISTKKQIKEKYESDIKVRNKQASLFKKYELLSGDIERLKKQLSELKEKAPSLDRVLDSLGDILNSYLKRINIKNRRGIAISDKTFLPVVRSNDYFKITSGGLRTITSIGYFLGILEYSIKNEINHPRLLMIDTVGKYLGKTTKSTQYNDTNLREDEEEGMSDPSKYQNIYEAMLEVASLAENKNMPCQIILVDNDVPSDFVERYKGFIVAHYSSIGEGGLPVGLIDDADKLLT